MTHPSSQTSPGPARERGINVLIVDDDREIVRAIDLRLSKAGFQTMTAFDGAEGLALALDEAPDAILMDLRMPVMDGFAMLERLQNSVHTASTPAIILSADSADRARLKALRGGATYFVEKPYEADALIRALTAAITPKAAATDAQSSQQREHQMSTQSDIEAEPNRRVLIADDDPAVVRALSVRCKKLGLEVETAENGLQAILKAQRRPPRLLILDINMPEADGFRVCEWLLDPRRPPVDVVMLTGRDDTETLGRCDSFGAFYVPKNQDTWASIRAILMETLGIDAAVLEVEDAMKTNIAEAELMRQKRNKILIVDDDADLTRALSRRLSKCGAETITASNGVEAYRLAVREKPSAIIADYAMPEGGGHYLLWRLKSTEATRHIPVIMITGQRFEAGTENPLERDSTGRAGAVALLRKPLDTEALFKELAQHCAIEYPPH
jgi:CheY-like chemotaxis protein